jgi:hypothetical protein
LETFHHINNMSILPGVQSWEPFKIDALGIVTLLGANALGKATGRLVANPYAEYLPQLAAHIFADGSVAEPLPGFLLYNITDGIKATDLNAWFTRWLSCQDIDWQNTTLEIYTHMEGSKLGVRWFIGCFLAGLLSCFLVAFPVVLGDWYGLASAIGLLLSSLMRSVVLFAYRRTLDRHAAKVTQYSHHPVKLFITLPSGKVVSIRTTQGITTQCLLTEVQPENHQLHQVARAVIWVAFATHAVTLGMASLCMQLVLVTIILLSTVLVVQQVGCDESRIGRLLRITRHDDASVTSRSKAYLKLDLDTKEEESMVKWDLFPLRSNEPWWQRYRVLQEEEIQSNRKKSRSNC